ncbi:MAG: LptF/LptG family permease [Saprospiraceae bacterium]|nr:LptF/LptG family permease [Saprospiraceae bacterium]
MFYFSIHWGSDGSYSEERWVWISAVGCHLLFYVFVILTKLFEKLSRSNTLDALFAAWLPCIILFPLGLYLSFKAMNDSKLLNVDRLVVWVLRLINKVNPAWTKKILKPKSDDLNH